MKIKELELASEFKKKELDQELELKKKWNWTQVCNVVQCSKMHCNAVMRCNVKEDNDTTSNATTTIGPPPPCSREAAIKTSY